MKIAMVTSQFAEIGGVENVVRSITKELKKMGHFVSLITRDRPQNNPKLQDEIFDEIIILKKSRRYIDYLFNSRKEFELLKNKYDVFHFHNWSTVFPTILMSLPSILTFHGTSYRVALDQKNYLAALLNWFLEEISTAIPRVVTSITKYHVKFLLPFRPMKIIPNGVDTKKFNKNYLNKGFLKKYKNKLKIKGSTILTVARLEKYKGIDYLIKSADYLEKPATILIPSNGSEKNRLISLSKKIKNRKISIKFLGRVSEKELLGLYSLANVFVMPSINEGLPCSLLEAMAFKLPVIVTDAGGMPEIVKKARCGYIVKKRNSKQISERLNFLIENSKKRQILGNGGYKYVKKYLDWEIIAQAYLKIYKKILIGKGKDEDNIYR